MCLREEGVCLREEGVCLRGDGDIPDFYKAS